ncbi:MFS transporter [Chloroflexota bacterium]
MIKKVFPILGLSVFSSMLGAGIVAPLLPLYAESLGATGIWIGAIFAGFAISRTVFTPVFGRLSDRSGRKLFISIGLILYATISLGFVWTGTVYQLVLMRFLHGASAAMIVPIAQAYIGDVCPEGEEGRWMGYANAAFFTGFGFGPFIGGVLTEHFGIDASFLTMGGLNLVAFLVAALFLPEVSRRKLAANPAQLSFRKMSGSSTVKGIFSFRLGFSLSRGAFAAFLPIFATINLGLSPTFVGTLLAIHFLLRSLLGVVGGRVADRLSRRVLMVIGSLINLTFLALIPLTHSFGQLLWLCIFGSLGGALAQPASLALSVEEGRKYGMGLTIAMFSMAMSIGMAIGPILAGVIADVASVNSVFYFGAAMGFAGAALFVWFTRSK